MKSLSFTLILLIVLGAAVPACSLESTSSASLFQSSFTQEAQGHYGAALSPILRLLEQEPDNYTANLRAGWLLYLNQDYPLSIKFYTRACSLAPRALEPLLGLLLPLVASGEWQKAEAAAREALALAPGNAQAMGNLAYIRFAQERYDEALALYTEALSA